MNIVGLSASTIFFGKKVLGKITGVDGERVLISFTDSPDSVTGKTTSYSFSKKDVEILLPLEEVEKMELPRKVKYKSSGN